MLIFLKQAGQSDRLICLGEDIFLTKHLPSNRGVLVYYLHIYDT